MAHRNGCVSSQWYSNDIIISNSNKYNAVMCVVLLFYIMIYNQ